MELPALGHLPGWVGGKKIQMLPAAFRSGQTLARACCAIRVGQGWTWVQSAQHTVGTRRGSPPPASARGPCAASPTRPPCPYLGDLRGRWHNSISSSPPQAFNSQVLEPDSSGFLDLGTRQKPVRVLLVLSASSFSWFLDGGLHLGTRPRPVRVRLVQSASCL